MPFMRGKGYKNRPLPVWFQNWISKQKLIRYKDLLVPSVQFKVVAKNDDGNVNVGISINGKDVYGNILVFPYFWTNGLTTDSLFSGFEEKLSRHLNMISKGCTRGTPQQIKLQIDSFFLVNCLVSPRPKPIKTRHTILRTNTNGQVVDKYGKVVGMSGTVLRTAIQKGQNPMAYANSLGKPPKKKKNQFNPSKR
jgi:hypothetical protein